MEPVAEDLYRFGVALAIGALIGVERQYSGTRPGAADAPTEAPAVPPPDGATAGVRTYALFALMGGVTAHLAPSAPWLLPAALLVLGALLLASYLHGLRTQQDAGLTSEVSAVLTFLLGAMAVSGHTTVAGACAVVVTGLLALKRRLHELAWKVKQDDILAALKLAVITVVILPILPAEPLVLGDWLDRREPPAVGAPQVAPEEAPAPSAPAPPAGREDRGERPWYHDISISPRKVWHLVVLISGVSFAGYVLVQVLGAARGLFVTAALGGVASSTAVSLSFSQRSREQPDLSPRLGMGIIVANAIMPLRLLLVVALVDVRVALRVALPLLAMVAAGGLCALGLHLRRRSQPQHSVNAPALKNPFEITPALELGAAFALVLVVAQVVEALFGAAGTYGLSFVSGLGGADPISLALSEQAAAGRVPATTAAIGVALAAASNTLVKGGFVVWLGAPPLRRIALAAFALMLGASLAGIAGLHILSR